MGLERDRSLVHASKANFARQRTAKIPDRKGHHQSQRGILGENGRAMCESLQKEAREIASGRVGFRMSPGRMDMVRDQPEADEDVAEPVEASDRKERHRS